MNKLNVLLKLARESAGVTQQELGEHLGFSSGHQYVSNWERGMCSPPPQYMAKIVSYLKIDEEDVFQEFMADAANEYKSLKIPEKKK